MSDKTVAVILGGGAGSRLYPLTKNRSKPAVPIGGKYRLIDIPISNCLNTNIRKIFVLTMFNSTSLNRHIKDTYHFDSFSSGFVDILAAEQTRESSQWFQGTADAVRQSLKHLENIEYDNVLVLSGDQLYNMDLEDVVNYHNEQKADVTISTIPVNAKDATGFGIMKVDADGYINNFIEKPSLDAVGQWQSALPKQYTDEGKNYLASMGIYVFNKQALKQLFTDCADANDFGKEVIPYAVQSESYTVASYSYDGYWADIGTISSFLEANLKMTEYRPEFRMYDNDRKIYTHARMLAPSKVFGCRIDNGLISEGCICYGDMITRSILGVRTRIGSATKVIDSIIMGNSQYQSINTRDKNSEKKLLGIGKNCHIEKAIIDRDVRIGNNVSIRGGESLEDAETETYCIREGIVVVKQNAIIQSNTIIGVPL